MKNEIIKGRKTCLWKKQHPRKPFHMISLTYGNEHLIQGFVFVAMCQIYDFPML